MDFSISNLSSNVFSVNKTADIQKTAEPKTEFQVSPSNQEMLANMSSKQLNNLYAQVTKATAQVMNNMQQNIFMRDVLGLPKDWSALLNEYAINTNNAQISAMLKSLNMVPENSMKDSLLALINANAKVDLTAIAELLNKNSALLADKLLKYMGNANLSQNNIAQLKNLMTIGASIAANAEVNPNAFLRDIIQMYLPWLPLVPPKEEDLNEIEEQFEGCEQENTQISFYISTNHLGYFKIEILLGETNEIYITNISDKPIADLKETLRENLIADIKKASIKIKLLFSQKSETENISLNNKQLFIVHSTDSIVGLTLIQIISKTIFEFDEKQGQRYSKAQNNN